MHDPQPDQDPLPGGVGSGIHNVDRKLIEVGQVLGLGRLALAWRVVLPAALPSLMVGARIGLTQAWLFLVAAELLASTRGLGFMLTEGQQISRTDEIITAIPTIRPATSKGTFQASGQIPMRAILTITLAP